MFKGKSFVAVIPARGGSKRLPQKNIRCIAGHPLLAWTIQAALKSEYIDRIIVTSDDDEILKIAGHYGSEFIKRPDELARDDTSTVDSIIHTINFLEELYDYIVLLQPTSPVRTDQDINNAIRLLEEKQADAIISVSEVDHTYMWHNSIGADGSLASFIPNDLKNARSQDMPLHYHINGAIYICSIKKLLDEKTFIISDNIFAYMMDKRSSIDIDDDVDLEIAESLLKGDNRFQ